MNRMLLKKENSSKFISHLDLMRTMQRVFIRAGLSIKHTQGFNPHPYISFALPLSVGTESVCELVDFELTEERDLAGLPELLTSKLPEGITVLGVYTAERKFKEIAWVKTECRFIYDKGKAGEAASKIISLFSGKSLIMNKKTKRGTAEVDIMPCIQDLDVSVSSENELRISAFLSAQDPGLSPSQLLSAIDQKIPDAHPDYYTFRRIEIFDKNGKIFR